MVKSAECQQITKFQFAAELQVHSATSLT